MTFTKNCGASGQNVWRLVLLATCLLSSATGFAQRRPINPSATSEARQLLKYLYKIQGKKTLSGMHNVLGKLSIPTDRVQQLTGKYPAIWGGDLALLTPRTTSTTSSTGRCWCPKSRGSTPAAPSSC